MEVLAQLFLVLFLCYTPTNTFAKSQSTGLMTSSNNQNTLYPCVLPSKHSLNQLIFSPNDATKHIQSGKRQYIF